MRRRYFTLDVFTDRRFTGNPLAVVLEPAGLEAAAMQAIAREFNLPETVFVFSPSRPEHRARMRIFTPAREMPFAGHPTVGTAVLLAHLDGGSAGAITLEEEIGPVRCQVEPGREGGHAVFEIPRKPERIGPTRDAARLAAAIGLEQPDLGCEPFRPENWTAGNPFTFIPLRGLAAVRRARPTWPCGATCSGPATRPPPLCSAGRSSIPLIRSMRACSRLPWASSRIPPPARRRRPSLASSQRRFPMAITPSASSRAMRWGVRASCTSA